MLFKRYASPFLILDEMINCGKLQEFIGYILNESLEETQWEYWLHKVTAMSFKDYCEACKEKDRCYGMTDSDVSRVKEMSKRILNKINPGRG